MKKYNTNQSDIQDIIHKYLHGKMNNKEAESFKYSIEQDQALREEVEDIRLLSKTLKAERRMETQKMLNGITSGMDLTPDDSALRTIEKRIDGTGRFNLMLTSAISIIVLLGVLAIWFFYPISYSKEYLQDLVRDYYHPFELAEALSEDANDNTTVALRNYNNRNYANVIAMVGEYAGKTPEMDVLMALGVSHIEQGNLKQAKDVLSIVASDTIDVYAPDAIWYLGLINLRQCDAVAAAKRFNTIKDNPAYQGDIKNILAELPKNRFNKIID